MMKTTLSSRQIWNMNFGFFGIQFGWGLQMANMSAIYQYLGAREEDIAWLWIAAPLTGLIVQPIVGYYSDRTWNALGRRRPYFLVGSILATLALIAMPARVARFLAGWNNISLNGRALAFSLLLAVAAGAISGFAPALAALRVNLVDQL